MQQNWKRQTKSGIPVEINYHNNAGDGYYTIKVTNKRNYKFLFYYHPYSTGNCRMGSLSRFQQVISDFNPIEVKEILRALADTCHKSQFIIDIHERYRDKLRKLKPLMTRKYPGAYEGFMILAILKID